MDNEELTKIFAVVGEKFNYRDVDAKFCEFKDFKVNWTRSYQWARFEVSDYLEDAPKDVIRDLATALFAKIANQPSDYDGRAYPPAMTDYLTSQEFRDAKRPMLLDRLEAKRDETMEKRVRDMMDEHNIEFDDLLILEGEKYSSPLFRVLSCPGWMSDREIFHCLNSMLDMYHVIIGE